MSLIKHLRNVGLASLCAVGAVGAQAAIVNGGFEAGPAAGAPTGWTDTDTVFGFQRCDVAGCGTGAGSTGPAGGSFWIWFGGSDSAQTGVVSQNAVIESGSSALLFDFWAGLTGGTTSLTLMIDSVVVWSLTDATASTYASGYSTVSIALGALADGGSHSIRWDYSDAAIASSGSNWSLDNVRLAAGGTVPEPGSLALVGLAALGLAATRRRAQ